MHPRRGNPRRTPGHAAFVAAGVLGIIHAGFSLFWAVGGTWLLWSLGSGLLQTFKGREWILFPMGVVKLVAALTPLALLRRGWPARRLTRAACWLGAAVLILWGGLNTLAGNLVLSGMIQPSAGYDRPGMIGHALMWDPLFLVWGVALVTGLVASDRRGPAVRAVSRFLLPVVPRTNVHTGPGTMDSLLTRGGRTDVTGSTISRLRHASCEDARAVPREETTPCQETRPSPAVPSHPPTARASVGAGRAPGQPW